MCFNVIGHLLTATSIDQRATRHHAAAPRLAELPAASRQTLYVDQAGHRRIHKTGVVESRGTDKRTVWSSETRRAPTRRCLTRRWPAGPTTNTSCSDAALRSDHLPSDYVCRLSDVSNPPGRWPPSSRTRSQRRRRRSRRTSRIFPGSGPLRPGSPSRPPGAVDKL